VKLCPLSYINGKNTPCLKHSCAWFNEASQKCAVLELAEALNSIHIYGVKAWSQPLEP